LQHVAVSWCCTKHVALLLLLLLLLPLLLAGTTAGLWAMSLGGVASRRAGCRQTHTYRWTT
jgi:hypothetical protein